MQVFQSITKSFFVVFYLLASWQFNFNQLLFITGREVMAAPLELLGQNNTLQNKIQAKFNVANQALADGLEQNQELLGNTQQTFSQANAAIRQSIDPQQATSAHAQAISRRQDSERIAHKRLQVPSTLQDSTANEAQKPVEHNLQPTDNILKIQQAKLVNEAKTQTLSNQSTGTFAWKFIKNGVGVASEYSGDIKEQQQIQLELNSLRQNIADINVNGVEWLVQNSKDESVQQALNIEGFNIPSQGLTKEQAQQYTGALQQLVLRYEEQATLLEMRINTIAEKYTPYRLNRPQAQQKKTFPLKLKAAEQETQSLTQQANQVNENRQQRILSIQSPLNQNQEQPARTLDSSLSIGGHLDSKIPKANTFFANDTVDPGEYLAGLNTTSSVARKVLTNRNYWQHYPDNVKTQGSMSMAQNSLNAGSRLYILDDNVGNQNQSGYPDLTQQWFNFQVPAKKGYVPNIAYPEDNIDNTHGYAYLHKNVAFRRAINTTANKLGIPGSWIADVIAVETSFNPREFHRTNSCGYGGLIGFGTDDAQEFGTTLRRILSLPPERQMTYVEKYLSRPNIKRHLNRGVEYVAAAVFGGRGLLNKLIKNPSKALRTSDGAINLQIYMQRLGRDVGRRYDFNARLTKPTTFASSLDLQSRVRIVSINPAN
ncbi:hypothetical protein DP113_12670 [Brasilonema octagenarum UFV-E1]|uniref:Transglycosylase SLT domain-containing protein n=2 Tax=Bromeliae group (in: Brasilonema) TaxID=3398495 RepID=A0A856MD84_9CYAN|nr:hypothetical protein DP114_12735 [Brasilonema sennae CENA114]QDL14997.1 hypothetical protein DP113_12670 [Brasilonema octagenarum UFV-E1]